MMNQIILGNVMTGLGICAWDAQKAGSPQYSLTSLQTYRRQAWSRVNDYSTGIYQNGTTPIMACPVISNLPIGYTNTYNLGTQGYIDFVSFIDFPDTNIFWDISAVSGGLGFVEFVLLNPGQGSSQGDPVVYMNQYSTFNSQPIFPTPAT